MQGMNSRTGRTITDSAHLALVDEADYNEQIEFKRMLQQLQPLVEQELAALGVDPTFSWSDARAEIEFILADGAGNIIPLEVKSGKRTKARSLQSYIEKCNPVKTIKLTGTQGSGPLEQQHLVYPLYYTAHAVRKHLLSLA